MRVSNRKKMLRCAVAFLLLLALCACSGKPEAAVSLGGAQSEFREAPDRERPVIFIQDGGTGDGSSADSPLAVVHTENAEALTGGAPAAFYDSVLYQAAAKLFGTGGTIVICGEVKLSPEVGRGVNSEPMDYPLPNLGDAGIVLTSVYDGVDYRETNGARLILQTPVSLLVNNPATFENIELCTMGYGAGSGANLMIYGGGRGLVMGEGVVCTPLDSSGKPIDAPSIDLYPSISGALLYNTVWSDTSVEIASGTYYNVYAGASGISGATYGDVTGSSHLTIGGDTTVYGTVSGTSGDNRALLYGDVDIRLTGGNFYGKLLLCSQAGMASAANRGKLTVTGGTFSDRFKFLGRVSSLYQYKLLSSVFDCTGYTGETKDLVSHVSGFTSVACAADDLSAPTVSTEGAKTAYFAGDLFDPAGITVTGKVNDKETSIVWTPDNQALTFRTKSGDEIDPESTPLTASVRAVQIYYGEKKLGELKITVQDRPAVEILGAALKPGAERQPLGFVIGVEDRAVSGITVGETGVLVLPSSYLSSHLELLNGSIAGFETVAASALPDGLLCESTGTGAVLSYAALDGIPVEEYGAAYTAVAYLKFTADGAEQIAYSLPYTTSVYSAACSLSAAEFTQKVESGAHSTPDPERAQALADAAVNYFETMATQKWVCPTDIDFAGAVSWTGALQYFKGETYTGLPYLAGMNGVDNLESFLRYVDEDGVYTGETKWATMHGNNCTSAAFQSVSRFTNSYSYYQQKLDPLVVVIPIGNNDEAPFLPVGGYEVLPYDGLSTVIAQRQDRSVIYNAYAQARRGDYLYCYWVENGEILAHMRLITDCHVEYSADGSIDGFKSYLTIDEQTSTMDHQTNSSWGVDRPFSFAALYGGSYLPVRDRVFETGYAETPHCIVRNPNTAENIADGLTGVVLSNYDISLIEVTVTDVKTGEVVFDEAVCPYFCRAYGIGSLDPSNRIKDLGTGYEFVLTVTTANEAKEYVRFTF